MESRGPVELDLPYAIGQGGGSARSGGVPVVFRRYREWTRGPPGPEERLRGVPGESSAVEALAAMT